jgi:hypothetical protein
MGHLNKEPFTGASLKDFDVEGYRLVKSTSTESHRHYKDHVYRVKGTSQFRKNQARLDTVKRYAECFEVWEYEPTAHPQGS